MPLSECERHEATSVKMLGRTIISVTLRGLDEWVLLLDDGQIVSFSARAYRLNQPYLYVAPSKF